MENPQMSVESPQNHTRLQATGCCRCRRICKWTHPEDSCSNGDSNLDSGAEFLCWCDQQTPSEISQQDMCGLRRNGTILPCRQNHHDGKSCSPAAAQRNGSQRGSNRTVWVEPIFAHHPDYWWKSGCTNHQRKCSWCA